MKALFSESGMHRLDQVVCPGLLCVFDFDGTLSPIVAQPEHAHLPDDVMRRLVELMKHTPVAIITGRSVADIRERLGFAPHFIAGNHGLEGVPGWEPRAQRYEDICRSWRKKLERALQDHERFGPGIRIEDKRYSLSVHYRLAHDQEQAAAALHQLFATQIPEARVIGGKCVFNLLPPDAVHKGSALEQLMQISGACAAIYVGDDVTDEDVFRLHRPDVLTVRVEKAPHSAAELFLHDRAEIVQLLDELIRRLRTVRYEAAGHQVSAHNSSS
jgi:trehalose 6-phosphate phosphatase